MSDPIRESAPESDSGDNSDDSADRDFPSSRLKRSGIAASTGLKVGANYARYLARRSTGQERSEARRELNDRNARDVFSQLTRLRGTALKMAQGLAMDSGMLPEEFTSVLSQAQYSVPPMGAPLVRRIIGQSLGGTPEEIFAEFQPDARAAASLGQVHRARLKDGTDVAVKIQYPNVRESIDSDLRMVRGIVQRFLPDGSVDPYLEEVRERLGEETDYRQEGQNIEYFARQYASDRIVTPRWVDDLTTQNVLVMTFVEGVHLKEYLATGPLPEERNAYGQLLWDFVHRQISDQHLTVHADAHPGNFLFREEGRLGVLDFGCVKRFPRDFRDNLLRLFRSRMEDDEAGLMEAYHALEILRPSQPEETKSFLLEVLDDFGELIALPYRTDEFDFSDRTLIAGMQRLAPRLTGREAMAHRQPVGSRHFVFVNRLLLGLLSMMHELGARVDTSESRRMLLGALDS